MPIYEYECRRPGCGVVTEFIEKNYGCPGFDLILHTCVCGAQMHRKFSAPTFRLKGEGWAKDGYQGKGEQG